MRKWVILGGSLLAALAADQTSKNWVVNNMELYESVTPIPILAPLFQFTRSSNTGAAFGILPMAGDIFLLVALLIIAGLLRYFREIRPEARLAPFAIGLVVGGAVGNIVDRLQYGHVIDFIHYQIPNLISNVSNLADHAIVLGVLLVIAENLWREHQDKRSAPQSDSAA